MRLLPVIFALLAIAVPAGLAAAEPAGTLSIEDGRGTVVLKGKGIVIGRLDRGEVQIVDLTPNDQWSPRLNGVPRGRTVWTRGKDLNFYVPGGRYKITVRGEGFSISARGQGSAALNGRPDATGVTGTFAVGDDAPAAIPAAVTVPYGPPAVSSAAVGTKGLAP
jgi:hypothetical protein